MRYGPTPDYSYWSSTPALRCRVLVTWDRLELPHRYATYAAYNAGVELAKENRL